MLTIILYGLIRKLRCPALLEAVLDRLESLATEDSNILSSRRQDVAVFKDGRRADSETFMISFIAKF